MARRTKFVTIAREGRDVGKVFLLTEKDAYNAERWAIRLFLALGKAGIEIPEDVRALGLQGVFVMGLRAIPNVNQDDALLLLDELLECVQFVPDPMQNPGFARPLEKGIVEEIETYLQLRKEVFELHVGFSLADVEQTSEVSAAAEEPSTSPTTPISPPP